MKKAFTLIELLIVMTVIAILAGILIPSFRGFQSEAWLIKAEGDIGTLQMAVESYYRRNDNDYPKTLDELLLDKPRFINQLPNDPFKTDAKGYGYVIVTSKPGSEPFYIIYSQGPNRIKDWTWNETNGEVIMNPNSDDIIFTNAILQ